MKSGILALLVIILFSSIALAQGINLEIEGKCKEFNVTITADMPEGCYDVKIDITTPSGRVGRIYDPREGWKSSIYYVDEALCVEEEVMSETFTMAAETSFSQLYFQPKLRAGSKTWDGNYTEFTQNCPEAVSNDNFVFLVPLIVILIMLVLITLYVKRWKEIIISHK